MDRSANSSNPAVSAIFVVDDDWDVLRPAFAWLAGQSRPERIEIVVVGAVRADDPDAPDGAPFADVRVERLGADVSMARRSAAGIRVAEAPLVLLGETHAFGAPNWVDAVLAAHESLDVVVPTFVNGNPSNPLSWAGFIQDYGDFGPGRPPGPEARWPGHNATYARSLLLGLGPELEETLARGDLLCRRLSAAGARAGRSPDVRMEHVNVSRTGSWLRERWLLGRLLAGERRAAWPRGRAVAYAAASPLIALVLMQRNLGALRRHLAGAAFGTVAAWILSAGLRAAGEAIGYLAGADATHRRTMQTMEIRRFEHAAHAPRGLRELAER